MDLADKITALQRKKAAADVGLRTRGVVNVAVSSGRADNAAAAAGGSDQNGADRAIRRPQETSPRRSSASSQHQQMRSRNLFNPESDPIPVIRPRQPQEPVSPQSQHAQPQPPQRQLFDPRRDDPMRFAVLNNQAQQRQTSSSVQSSMDHSSISSYASSTWTLTSSTGTSQSSAPPEQPQDRDGTSKFVTMLKKVYREITEIEKKIKEWDNADEHDNLSAQVTMLKPGAPVEDVPEPQDPLRSLVAQHRQLAELYHSMITMILQPVPASMLSFVTKYQLPTRLWTNGIAHCIDCLRRMGPKYPGAGEYITSYIYWAYHFYEALYETSTLNEFMAPYKINWIEALGDLARWHMHITSRQSSHEAVGSASVPLTEQALPAPAPKMTDTPPPSIGLVAAQAFDLEPESEIWRKSSQTWYAMVLKETPGAGKLHHNLGLLNSEVPNEELRGVYHFVKSMTANHPYVTSREAILTLFSKPAQQRRNLAADAKSPELFVLLHGMLFTNIQLDDFQPTLVRYLERLQLDGAQEREWIMMAVVNITAILQYGKADAMIKIPTGTGSEPAPTTIAGKKRELVLKMDSLAMTDSPVATHSSDMDIDNNSMTFDVPHSLQLALQLAFSTLSFCLQHPFRRSSPFAKPTLNPYITVLLTFLQTILKQPGVLSIIERSFPWDDLIAFLRTVPRRQLQKEVDVRAKLTSGCAPLPEDWCLRGMAWSGRRVYEHGFWPRGATSGGGITGEMDILLADENMEQETDGIIEDEGDGRGEDVVPKDYTGRRWVRTIRSGLSFVQSVPGFELYHGDEGISWRLGETMERKAEMWKEEERREREEEERRRNRHWSDDEDDEMLIDEEEEEEIDDDPEVRALQERRRYLKSLQNGHSPYGQPSYTRPRRSRAPTRSLLDVRPGYTILVLDTNILLSALPAVITLIESERWTILIPLAVITELDGISNNHTELGKVASEASQYVTSHIRSHSTSLKVQTSRGNYLTTLNVRSEQFDFFSGDRRRRSGGEKGGQSWERSLDDLILRAALWQEAHWIDRSELLRGLTSNQRTHGSSDAAKVVLLTFDRNLRLKARSRHLHAGDERDLANILRVNSPS
ncbi:hypothetical protein FRC20_009286 [Serendipita sp. 405]|nr:hypothetical protein FRC20_009286 [Serendipita sp. 405]